MSRLDEIKARDICEIDGGYHQADEDRRYLLELNAELEAALRDVLDDDSSCARVTKVTLSRIAAALAKVDA